MADTLHGFTRDDLECIADGLEAGYEKTVDVAVAKVESSTAAAARFIRAALDAESPPSAPDTQEVKRVLGYLRTDEAQIRAAKVNAAWADTMARASVMIRNLAATPGVIASVPPHPCRWFNGRCIDCGRAYGEPRTAGVVATPEWCAIHQHHKWCEHNGGVMGPNGWQAPAGVMVEGGKDGC